MSACCIRLLCSIWPPPPPTKTLFPQFNFRHQLMQLKGGGLIVRFQCWSSVWGTCLRITENRMRYQIRAQIEEEDFNNNFNILLTTSEIYALFGNRGSLAKFPEHNYKRRDWICISSECRIYQSELVAPFFLKGFFNQKRLSCTREWAVSGRFCPISMP